jgi:hypothetical protein
VAKDNIAVGLRDGLAKSFIRPIKVGLQSFPYVVEKFGGFVGYFAESLGSPRISSIAGESLCERHLRLRAMKSTHSWRGSIIIFCFYTFELAGEITGGWCPRERPP